MMKAEKKKPAKRVKLPSNEIEAFANSMAGAIAMIFANSLTELGSRKPIKVALPKKELSAAANALAGAVMACMKDQ